MRLATSGEETPEELRELALELGEVPQLFKGLANSSDALQGVWALTQATLLRGKIPRTTKELIALAATSVAKVTPLSDLLRRSLAGRGLDERVLDDLVATGETVRLPERTQRILFLGRRAALQPALLTDGDFAKVRRDGLEDAELAELVAFAGLVATWIATSRALGCT